LPNDCARSVGSKIAPLESSIAGRTDLPDRIAEIAADFVRLNVDVILTEGPAVTTLERTTASIPIIFALASDPVGGGLVASLARPGGNVTGLSLESTDLAGKRVELLREVVPHLRRLAILVDVGFAQSLLELGAVQAMARTSGVEVASVEIRRAEDIALAFKAPEAQADALHVVGSDLIDANRTQIIKLVRDARLPAIFSNRDHVRAGARHAADFADKILRGTKPADLPVEQGPSLISPSTFSPPRHLASRSPRRFCCKPTR